MGITINGRPAEVIDDTGSETMVYFPDTGEAHWYSIWTDGPNELRFASLKAAEEFFFKKENLEKFGTSIAVKTWSFRKEKEKEKENIANPNIGFTWIVPGLGKFYVRIIMERPAFGRTVDEVLWELVHRLANESTVYYPVVNECADWRPDDPCAE